MRLSVREIHPRHLVEQFGDKRVALVGPAPEMLEMDYGPMIDGHDIVIRMNAAVPELADKPRAIGTKTDVLAVAKMSAYVATYNAGCRPKSLWWMKLTEMGQRDHDALRGHLRANPGNVTSFFRYPRDMELRVTQRVGAPPTTGLRVIDALEFYGYPACVTVFGMNFLGADGGNAASWWKDDKPHAPVHDGKKEFEVFKVMGNPQRFRKDGPLRWTCLRPGQVVK